MFHAYFFINYTCYRLSGIQLVERSTRIDFDKGGLPLSKMKTFLKYLFTFLMGIVVGLAGLVIIGIVVLASSDFTKEKPEIPANGILRIALPMNMEEKGTEESFGRLIGALSGNMPLSLNAFKRIIKNAADDSRIVAITIDPGMFSGGLAKAQEIRQYIDTFQASGKPVWCYSENFSEQGFYIASTCDRIFANPKGVAEFNGFSSGIVMYKGLLDKLGLDVQVFKVGKFKGAVEPYTQEKLSDNNREQIASYLGSLFKVQLDQIAVDRNANRDSLMAFALYGNSYLMNNCQQAGLIDKLVYFDEFEAFLKSKHPDYAWVERANYPDEPADYAYEEDKIAVVYLEGEIIPGKSESEGQIASDDVCKMLRKIRLDENIKAVVLRINSPGGSSVASDLIAREISLIKAIKPVVSSFSNVAASGGYYIACLSDSIFADRTSITGSIGVFALIPNTSQVYNKTLGLGYESVNSGPQSELWRPDQPLSEAQQRVLQGMVDGVYEDFTGIVAKGRKLSISRVKEIAEGRVYSGVQALEIGLIDGFGGLDYSIQSAARKAKLKRYRVREFPTEKDPFEQLFAALEMKALIRSSVRENPLGSSLIKSAEHVSHLSGIQMRVPWSTDYR